MASLSLDRVIAPSTSLHFSSRATLGKLLYALKEGQPSAFVPTEEQRDFIHEVRSLRFNSKKEQKDFIVELICWVEDSRLPIPQTNSELAAFARLLRCVHAKRPFDLTEIRQRLNLELLPTAHALVCNSIKRRQIANFPKRFSSWLLIIALLRFEIKLIYIEALTFNKTIDIVEEETLIHLLDLIIGGASNEKVAYILAYFIQSVLDNNDTIKVDKTILDRKFKHSGTKSINDGLTNNDVCFTYIFNHYITPTFDSAVDVFSYLPLSYRIRSIISSDKAESFEQFKAAVIQFFKYIPTYFIRNYMVVENNFYPNEFLTYLYEGKPLKQYNEIFSSVLNSKALHLLTNLKVGEVTVENSLIYVHLLSLGVSKHLISDISVFFRMNNNIRIMFTQTYAGVADMKKSFDAMTAIGLFLKNNESVFSQLAYNEKGLTLGYLSHCFQDVANYSLKGRTLNSIQRAATEWEVENRRARTYGYAATSWKGANYQEWNALENKQWHAIFQLTTQTELSEESAYMAHCVSGYGYRCTMGQCSIWSLRVKREGHWVRLATIEVNSMRQIVQVKAKYNAIPVQPYLEMVQAWATKNQLTIVRY